MPLDCFQMLELLLYKNKHTTLFLHTILSSKLFMKALFILHIKVEVNKIINHATY